MLAVSSYCRAAPAVAAAASTSSTRTWVTLVMQPASEAGTLRGHVCGESRVSAFRCMRRHTCAQELHLMLSRSGSRSPPPPARTANRDAKSLSMLLSAAHSPCWPGTASYAIMVNAGT